MTMQTARGTWNIYGINLVSTDCIYQDIKTAIENGTASHSMLQRKTGYRAPIFVDFKHKTINFRQF